MKKTSFPYRMANLSFPYKVNFVSKRSLKKLKALGTAQVVRQAYQKSKRFWKSRRIRQSFAWVPRPQTRDLYC